MASIGSFKKSGSEFQGEIVTLSVQTKNVRIVPEINHVNDNAPSHRVYIGRAEIGAAWLRLYGSLSLRFDAITTRGDPPLGRRIGKRATLRPADSVVGTALIRPKATIVDGVFWLCTTHKAFPP